MAKRVEITDRIKEMVRAATQDDIDYNEIVVFEACAASTRPITKKGHVYDRAVLSENFLAEMASCLPSQKITLQIMHNDDWLPIGTVFFAQVLNASEGHKDLNVLFYLDKNSEYVRDIDLSIIDEVSIGALPKHVFCSECDFDYRSDLYALYERECPNGHQIGLNGVHLRLTSLERWSELSLVNRGASSKAKILSTTKQRIGTEEYGRLAANSDAPLLTYLYASATPTKEKPLGGQMDPKILELSTTNGRLEEKLSAMTSERDGLTLKLSEQGTELKAAKDKIAELTASGSQEKVDSLTLQLNERDSAIAMASDAIRPHYKLACAATNCEVKEDATLQEMTAFISQAQVKLAAVPRGQQTKDTEPSEDALKLNAGSRNACFVTSKN